MISDGWVKDGDYNTTFSRTVLPLPTHRERTVRSAAGPARGRSGLSRGIREDFATYHTRYVTPDAGAPRADAPETIPDDETLRPTGPRRRLRGAARHAGPDAAGCGRGPPSPPATVSDAACAVRVPADGVGAKRRASTSSTRRRRSMPSSRTSCRRWRRWAPPSRSSTSIADGLADLYVTNSREGSRNRLYRNRGDGTFEDIAGASGPRRRESARDRRVDGGGVGRLRQRRLRGPAAATGGGAPSCSTTTAAARSRRSASGGPAGVGEHQLGRLARLRPRRAARFVPRRLLSRERQPLEAADTKMMPESFEYADERRAQVPVSQSRRRPLRGGQRAGRASRHAAGRWRRSPPTCAAPAIPISSSPTTTASPSCSSTRAAGSARSAARPASATRRRAA